MKGLSSSSSVSSLQRVEAVDTLRGLTMAVMIFNSYNYWGDENLRHIAWGGMNLADFELPAFVLVLGFSKAEAMRQHQNKPLGERARIVPDMFWRMFILTLLGLLYNGTPIWNIKTMRFPSVLFRLGCVDFLLSLILLFVPRLKADGPFKDIITLLPQWSVIFCFVACYFGIVYFLPVPGCTSAPGRPNYGYLAPGGLADGGLYEKCTGGATFYIDKLVFGENHLQHYPACQNAPDIMCEVNFDDLGLVGILTTCLSAFIGVQLSEIHHVYLQDVKPERYSNVIGRWIAWALFLFGITMVCTVGHDPTHGNQSRSFIPVIKSLWTPSFATFNASLDIVILCVLFACMDVPCGKRRQPIYPDADEASLLNDEGEPTEEVEGYPHEEVEIEGPPLFNGALSSFFAPFRAMGKNSIGAYLGSRFCYTWMPIAFPSFFGLGEFTRRQLLMSSIGVTMVFLLVCWLLERDRMFFDFCTRRPPWKRVTKRVCS